MSVLYALTELIKIRFQVKSSWIGFNYIIVNKEKN